jgi:ribosome biogenesis GTPase A
MGASARGSTGFFSTARNLASYRVTGNEHARPCDEHGLLAFIATSRHLVKAGGPDIARAATTLLNDFRSGALGRISLETVEG